MQQYTPIGNTTLGHMYSYGTHAVGLRPMTIIGYNRRLQPRDPPRSSERSCHYLCRKRATTRVRLPSWPWHARGVRTYTQSPSVLIDGRKHEPFDDGRRHAPQALAVDAIQPGEAAERRCREHGSDHTDICRHGDELAGRRCCPPSLCSHHLLPKLPKPVGSARLDMARHVT